MLRPQGELALPVGGTLHLDSLSYYARLSVVDDKSIPLLYIALTVALVGLTVAVATRQQIVLVTTVPEPDGVRLVARLRLWRNTTSTRSEIERELVESLGQADKGSTP